ncbi:MAG: hypothetical protein JW704_12780 [Anaerolineaceae bacterium]|nr:hypothetical protein [Anaerolineaceae bacterium]
MKKILLLLAIAIISLFMLSGCQSDTGAKTGEKPAEGYPASDGSEPLAADPGYPAPVDTETASDPGYPAPAGAPVRPNASRMNVEILSLAESEKGAEFMLAHVRVNSTAPVEGMDEYDPNLAGQEIDITLAFEDGIMLAFGDIINLTVAYRGDEWGGGYFGSEISYPD